tara:strand:+ start:189 stop:362 length:174 start_codon:yes stop_codon:yes gene_type:complete
MIHNCDQCDGKYDCVYGNPCSSHGEQIWCSKECQEAWFEEIFQANLKEELKNEEEYL